MVKLDKKSEIFITLLSIFGGFILGVLFECILVLFAFSNKSEGVFFSFLFTPIFWAIFSLWIYLAFSKKQAFFRFIVICIAFIGVVMYGILS